MEVGAILSIGQGARTVAEMIATLQARAIAFLIDVRSRPGSRFRPEFSRARLRVAVARAGIRYVYMGDALGGIPDDPACYVGGVLDDRLCRARPAFVRGIERLMHARARGLRVCLMCAEGQPAGCHRTRLIGASLADEGVELVHILPDGSLARQVEVVSAQLGLFERSSAARRGS